MLWLRPRSLLLFLLPGGLLLVAAGVAVERLEPNLLAEWIPAYGLGVGVAALLLGWRMKRGRLVLAVLVPLLAERLLALPPAPGLMAGAVLPLIMVLAPLNLALVALLRERGLFTRPGLVRIVLLLTQAGAAWWVVRRGGLDPATLLTRPVPGLELPPLGGLPPWALLFSGVSLGVILLQIFRTGRRTEIGLLWALGAILWGLAGVPEPVGRSFLLISAGFILVISSVEESLRYAFQDELTGLPARRALNDALVRLGNRYAVAMVDIDHFKRFNDRYGHEAGDQVLRMVAARLAGVSGGGRAYRYGGEEFTLLFPGRTVEQAQPHAERLRKSIAGSSFVIRSRRRPRKKPDKPKPARTSRRRVRVRVSIGLAEPSDRHPTPEDVIQAADKALYRAKKAGRNRVVS